MAKSKHDQKPRLPASTRLPHCSNCREYDCHSCVDVTRAKVFRTDERVCGCDHSLYLETHDNAFVHDTHSKLVQHLDGDQRHAEPAVTDHVGAGDQAS